MKLKLDQQRLEVAYSLFLILLIPLLIITSTILLTGRVKSDFDQELRRKANMANAVFGVSVTNLLAKTPTDTAAAPLQALIDQARAQAPEIDNLAISLPNGSGFKTLASSDTSRISQPDESIQTQVAWSNQQPVASLIAAGEGQTRKWLVATPITTTTGAPLAVITMRVSLDNADAALSTTLRGATIGLAIMLVVIITLLLHHFRVVQYAELFRKQRELDQMKDDFISIATHELKSPMSVIKGYLSMVLESKLAKDVREMTQIAYSQTDRLTHLVNDLLDVSRIEQGRTKYDLAPVRLTDIIKPMMLTYEVRAKDKRLKLVYQPPADLPAVTVDPDRVSEVFANLIDNAIKYSVHGTVTVAHQVTPEAVITTVTDTGIGMTAEEQSRLFARFYRARNHDTAEIPGTGLGLWIIKQYIERMNGHIHVESEKGRGSTFVVNLPRAN